MNFIILVERITKDRFDLRYEKKEDGKTCAESR
jgi:hypothetical protein